MGFKQTLNLSTPRTLWPFFSLSEPHQGSLFRAQVARRDRIVVSTLRCGRSNLGSNPSQGIAGGNVTAVGQHFYSHFFIFTWVKSLNLISTVKLNVFEERVNNVIIYFTFLRFYVCGGPDVKSMSYSLVSRDPVSKRDGCLCLLYLQRRGSCTDAE